MYFFMIISILISAISAESRMRDYMGYHVPNSEMSGLLMVFVVFLVFVIIISVIYAAIKGGLEILINRQIYERYTTVNMATLHAVFSMIIPFYESVCMFIFGRRAEQNTKENMAENQLTIEEEE